jgi:hypothetical protein
MDHDLKANRCVFTVGNPNPDVYMVVKIEKVLQGEIEASQEAYLTTLDKKTEMDKAKKKIMESVPTFCPKFGNYRQVFAWAAIPVFKPDGTLDLKPDTTIDYIYRQSTKEISDNELLEFITEMVVRYRLFRSIFTLSRNIQRTLSVELNKSLVSASFQYLK